jgi:hypothetical protein
MTEYDGQQDRCKTVPSHPLYAFLFPEKLLSKKEEEVKKQEANFSFFIFGVIALICFIGAIAEEATNHAKQNQPVNRPQSIQTVR